jgi:hypothetical protein
MTMHHYEGGLCGFYYLHFQIKPIWFHGTIPFTYAVL